MCVCVCVDKEENHKQGANLVCLRVMVVAVVVENVVGRRNKTKLIEH